MKIHHPDTNTRISNTESHQNYLKSKHSKLKHKFHIVYYVLMKESAETSGWGFLKR